ncbi:MAG: lactate utilization protein [Daejeonella sp.]|uniref:LutC/YkgG family protein n=1 Tax=Daejeonella sp. TaxID=2805397 RepID=UPI003C73BBE3
MKDTTPKERMLKKIRKALLEKRDNPYPNLEDTPLYEEYTDHIDLLFAEQLTAVAGNFIFCEDDLQLAENLLHLAEEKKWRKIYCWEPAMQALLSKYEFPHYTTDTDFLDAEVGITSCEALVARNGSVLISNGNPSGRRLSIYPNVHIVIAYTSQLVLDLKDAFKLLKLKYPESSPTMVSNITGPSRTADIEKTLVLGAHGPKELYVFLSEG